MEKFEFGPIQTKWLESLEQNPERQEKEKLGIIRPNDSYGACCLGELGLMAGLCEFNSKGELYVIGEKTSNSTGILSGVHEQVGLYSACGSPKKYNDGHSALTFLNDNKCTWPEIAAIIRANPTVYFSKPV